MLGNWSIEILTSHFSMEWVLHDFRQLKSVLEGIVHFGNFVK